MVNGQENRSCLLAFIKKKKTAYVIGARVSLLAWKANQVRIKQKRASKKKKKRERKSC